jgi:hypothetical protein
MAVPLAFKYCDIHSQKSDCLTDAVKSARAQLVVSVSDDFINQLDGWDCWRVEDDTVCADIVKWIPVCLKS